MGHSFHLFQRQDFKLLLAWSPSVREGAHTHTHTHHCFKAAGFSQNLDSFFVMIASSLNISVPDTDEGNACYRSVAYSVEGRIRAGCKEEPSWASIVGSQHPPFSWSDINQCLMTLVLVDRKCGKRACGSQGCLEGGCVSVHSLGQELTGELTLGCTKCIVNSYHVWFIGLFICWFLRNKVFALFSILFISYQNESVRDNISYTHSQLFDF